MVGAAVVKTGADVPVASTSVKQPLDLAAAIFGAPINHSRWPPATRQ